MNDIVSFAECSERCELVRYLAEYAATSDQANQLIEALIEKLSTSQKDYEQTRIIAMTVIYAIVPDGHYLDMNGQKFFDWLIQDWKMSLEGGEWHGRES